jgi:hypothetical protein
MWLVMIIFKKSTHYHKWARFVDRHSFHTKLETKQYTKKLIGSVGQCGSTSIVYSILKLNIFVILVVFCPHISRHFKKIGKFSNFLKFTASYLFEFLRYTLGGQDELLHIHSSSKQHLVHLDRIFSLWDMIRNVWDWFAGGGRGLEQSTNEICRKIAFAKH